MTNKQFKAGLQSEINNAGFTNKIQSVANEEVNTEIIFERQVINGMPLHDWLNNRFKHGVTLDGTKVLVNTPNNSNKQNTLHEDLIDMVKVIKEYEYEKLMPVTKIALDSLLKRIK